jgi:hypothetical protein
MKKHLNKILPEEFSTRILPLNFRFIQSQDYTPPSDTSFVNRKKSIIIKDFQIDECFPTSSYKAISKFFNPTNYFEK